MIESESVIKFIEEKKTGPGFTINTSALSQLIPEQYNEYPICILCIMGASRCGKSFFLNFVVRYLGSLEKGNDVFEFVNDGREPSFPKWMIQSGNCIDGFVADDEEPMTRGFSVRGGDSRNTTGILFWNRPFLVTQKNGDHVCILVMDTQGLWDEDTSNDFNACIFGVSSILSSYLIFNHKGTLTVETLKQLSNLSVFSRGITGRDDNPAFQHLDILFRDHPNYRLKVDDVSAAERLSQEKLEKLETKPQLKPETETLKKCFHSFHVFCLPKPGDVDDLDYDGRIDVMNPLFLQVLGRYIASVIDTIEPRRLGDQVLTGEAFKEFATGYAQLFSEGTDFPDSRVLLDVAVSVKNGILQREGLRMFENLATTAMEGTGTDEEFDETMKEITENVLTFYDAHARGSQTVAEKGRKELEWEIQVRIKDWQVRREQKRVKETLQVLEEERQRMKEEQRRNQQLLEEERREQRLKVMLIKEALGHSNELLRQSNAQQRREDRQRQKEQMKRQQLREKEMEQRHREEKKKMERTMRSMQSKLDRMEELISDKQQIEREKRTIDMEKAKIQEEKRKVKEEKQRIEMEKQKANATKGTKKPAPYPKPMNKQNTTKHSSNPARPQPQKEKRRR